MIAITVLIMLEDIVVKQNRNYKIIAFIKDINNVCKLPFKRRKFFCVIGNFVHITQKRSARMRLPDSGPVPGIRFTASAQEKV